MFVSYNPSVKLSPFSIYISGGDNVELTAMQKRAKSIVAAVGAMVIAASCGVCGGPAGTASIVGYWTFKGGVVDIRVSGS